MADFKRDTDGNILIENGDFVWLTGPAAIRQDIEFRLNVGLGECVYDVTKGTPWFQIIFLDSTSDDARLFILREIVRTTPGVIECSDLRLLKDAEGGIETITGSATTIDGEVRFAVDGSAINAFGN